jgi:hypothetical protein
MAMQFAKDQARYLAKYDRSGGPDACWHMTKQKPNKETGYCMFWLNGRVMSAQRAGHLLFNGPLPEGEVPDHLCRDRACGNPKHFEAVTQSINLLRAVNMGKGNRYKDQVTCPKGHPYDYVTPKGHRQCKTCKHINMKNFRMKKKAA